MKNKGLDAKNFNTLAVSDKNEMQEHNSNISDKQYPLIGQQAINANNTLSSR